MEVMAQGNRHIIDSDSKVDNNVVRQKVMDSYQDMLSGKGRDYKVFSQSWKAGITENNV